MALRFVGKVYKLIYLQGKINEERRKKMDEKLTSCELTEIKKEQKEHYKHGTSFKKGGLYRMIDEARTRENQTVKRGGGQ